ncbi:MAG: pyridoxal 5'-phosphate synthase glutaminase subunit PdxT [Desulfurococcales archaeon]|nr:pyridoxal 5'-phosphate synthase glutaminase subunit PdxT [Desulfurococcales archaeon]
MKIGVLGLQGGVYEHIHMLRKAFQELGYTGETVVVKKPQHLEGLDGIIIPGGESTAIGFIASRIGLLEPLREELANGLPAFGTCAGAIMLARQARDRVVGEVKQPLLASMDIEVVRNYFGRQRESFELDVEIEGIEGKFRGVFIRSPAIVSASNGARIISWVEDENGRIGAVAVQGATIATIFHPELTGDTRIHKLWLETLKR